MFFKLFLLFAIIPIVEIAVLVKLGTVIGGWYTILLVITTAIIGAYLVRIEGLSIMTRIQKSLKEGVFPAEELIDGALVLVAGAVLITPGLFTDFLGFCLVAPPIRKLFKGPIKAFLKKRAVMGAATMGGPFGSGGMGMGGPFGPGGTGGQGGPFAGGGEELKETKTPPGSKNAEWENPEDYER